MAGSVKGIDCSRGMVPPVAASEAGVKTFAAEAQYAESQEN